MKIIFPLNTALQSGKYANLILDLLIFPSAQQHYINENAKSLEISDRDFGVWCQFNATTPITKIKEIADDIISANQTYGFTTPDILEIPLWIKGDIGILDSEYITGTTYRQLHESDYPNAPFATNGSECIIRIPNWENCDMDFFLELYNKQGGLYNMSLLTVTQMQTLTTSWI
jgi:hypothetical protein